MQRVTSAYLPGSAQFSRTRQSYRGRIALGMETLVPLAWRVICLVNSWQAIAVATVDQEQGQGRLGNDQSDKGGGRRPL